MMFVKKNAVNILLVFAIIFLSYRFLEKDRAGQTDWVSYRTEVRGAYKALADKFVGMKFPGLHFRNAFTDSTMNCSFQGIHIVAVLSSMGCNPCQLRELRNLDSLRNTLKNEVKFAALFVQEGKLEAMVIRKAAGVNIDIFYASDTLAAQFNSSSKYPIVLLIDNQVIRRCYFPISVDEEYSRTRLSGFEDYVERSLSRR